MLLVLATLVILAGGVALGAVTPTPDLPTPQHNPALNAWPVHIVITVAVLAALAGWVWWARRGGRSADFLAPWRRSALGRLKATFVAVARGGPVHRLLAIVRCIVLLAVFVLLLFLVFRIGFQVTFTLDAAQTINAWGGPTYLGAFYAHFVDAVGIALIVLGVANLVADRLEPQTSDLPRS